MKTIKLLFILAVPVMMLSCNHNPNKNKDKVSTTSESSMGAGTVTGKDEDFVKDAASGGMMEVELGKYAEQNATNQRVKDFGSMIVRDHTKANDELRSLAASKNINLPGTMADSHYNKVSDLQKKKGTDFDKDYIKDMVDDHQKDIDEFKKQAENGSDPELKAFAAKTLPVLQAHLDSAKSVKNSLK